MGGKSYFALGVLAVLPFFTGIFSGWYFIQRLLEKFEKEIPADIAEMDRGFETKWPVLSVGIPFFPMWFPYGGFAISIHRERMIIRPLFPYGFRLRALDVRFSNVSRFGMYEHPFRFASVGWKGCLFRVYILGEAAMILQDRYLAFEAAKSAVDQRVGK